MQALFNEDTYSTIAKTLSFPDQIAMAIVCKKSLQTFKKIHSGFLEFAMETVKHIPNASSAKSTEIGTLMYLLEQDQFNPRLNVCLGLFDMYKSNIRKINRYEYDVAEIMVIAGIVNKMTDMIVDKYDRRINSIIYENIHLVIKMSDIELFRTFCCSYSYYGHIDICDDSEFGIVSKLIDFGSAEFLANVMKCRKIYLKYTQEEFYWAVGTGKFDIAKLILTKVNKTKEFVTILVENDLDYMFDRQHDYYSEREMLFHAIEVHSVPLFRYAIRKGFEFYNDAYIGIACCEDSYKVLKEMLAGMEKHGKTKIEYIDIHYAREMSVRCFKLIFPYIDLSNSETIKNLKTNENSEIASMLESMLKNMLAK